MTAKRNFFVIINPVSGNGHGKRVWQKIQPKLNLYYNITFCFTSHQNHEIDITHEALKNGHKHFIIIGGDGTLNNFINGVFSQQNIDTKSITFGIIPIGTGNDWVKTHGISKNIDKALDIIINNKTNTQDVGCINYLNKNIQNKYFINLAGIGFDGLVVNIVNKNRTFGKLTYILGAVKGLFKYHFFETRISLNSEVITSKACFMIQIGICKYTGSGMQLTHLANPKDGLFDITIATSFYKWDIIKNIFKLFNGKIVKHKHVKTFKTKRLVIETSNKDTYFQADGEQICSGKIEAFILPNAIQFYS